MQIGTKQYLLDLEQRSEEWHQRRAGTLNMGSFGSSETGTVAGKGKGREQLLHEKLVFIATGVQAKSFENGWMKRGRKKEEEAISALEDILADKYRTAGLDFNGLLKTGMVLNSDYPGMHDSPDALVDSTATPLAPVEVKVLSPSKHKECVEKWIKHKGVWIPSNHKWQCDTHRVINDSMLWFFCYDDIHGMHILTKVPYPDHATVDKIKGVAERWRKDWSEAVNDIDNIISKRYQDIEREEQMISSLKKMACKKLSEVKV